MDATWNGAEWSRLGRNARIRFFAVKGLVEVTNEFEVKGFAVDIERLPVNFPTQRHDAAFREALGRAVATFGFLEEVLGKAIFAFTATREIPPDQVEIE
jgi:hypothetical protein